MKVILEITTTQPAYDLFEKIGRGKIVAYEGIPVEECTQGETEYFTSLTIEI